METNLCRIKFRRGQNDMRKQIIPDQGEPIFTTDTKRLVIGDGITNGGVPITKVFVNDSQVLSAYEKGDLIYENGSFKIITNAGAKPTTIGGSDMYNANAPITTDGMSIGLTYDKSKLSVDTNSALTLSENYINSVDTAISSAVAELPGCVNNIETLSSYRIEQVAAPLYVGDAFITQTNNVNTYIDFSTLKCVVENSWNVNGKGSGPIITVDLNDVSIDSENVSANIERGGVLMHDNTVSLEMVNMSSIQQYIINGNTATVSVLTSQSPVLHVSTDGIIDTVTERIAENLYNNIYPVGSIYLTMDNVNPGTKFTGTTWQQISQGRFLLGASDSYSARSTGGESEVALTTAQMPSHNHKLVAKETTYNVTASANMIIHNPNNAIAGIGTQSGNSQNYTFVKSTSGLPATAGNSSVIGGDEPHNNMPPYLVCYMWQRIS